MYAGPSTVTTDEYWYALHCKSLHERSAAAALRANLGLPVYLPELKKYRHGHAEIQPAFPGYLFVWADLGEISPCSINSTPHVIRLVEFGQGPQPLSNKVMEVIRSGVEALNRQPSAATYGFQPGATVRLKSGPLRGLEAIFLGPMEPSARVEVLLEFLGRPNEVKVDIDILEQVHTPTTLPLERPALTRYTRGRGRKVHSALVSGGLGGSDRHGT